jgi:hypothetical protein
MDFLSSLICQYPNYIVGLIIILVLIITWQYFKLKNLKYCQYEFTNNKTTENKPLSNMNNKYNTDNKNNFNNKPEDIVMQPMKETKPKENPTKLFDDDIMSLVNKINEN